MNDYEGAGDAANALRKVIESRKQGTNGPGNSQQNVYLDKSNRRSSPSHAIHDAVNTTTALLPLPTYPQIQPAIPYRRLLQIKRAPEATALGASATTVMVIFHDTMVGLAKLPQLPTY